MDKARVTEDYFGDKICTPEYNTGITVTVRNSGKKRPILKKGWVVTVLKNSSDFYHGKECVKVITADGRMFSVDKSILEKI